MSDIALSASKISAYEERGAIFEQYTTAATVTLGQAVYLNSSNQVLPAIATSAAAAAAIGIAVIAPNFYGETSVASGQTVGVVVYGPVWGFTGLQSGQRGYVSKTAAGTIVTTAPAPGYQYSVGHAIDGETFFVDPGTAAPVSS